MKDFREIFDGEKFRREFRSYCIERYKNGKPKLTTLSYNEDIMYGEHFHTPRFESPEKAWKDFKGITQAQLKKLPLTRKDLQRDLKEAYKHL